MTKEQKAVLSLIRAIVRGDQGVPSMMNVCWAKYLEYVNNASFWYEIKLIFETFWVIVKER